LRNIAWAIFGGALAIAAALSFSQKVGTPVFAAGNGVLVTNHWSGEVFVCRIAPSPGDTCTRIYPDTPAPSNKN
jgi:hypothetical protein